VWCGHARARQIAYGTPSCLSDVRPPLSFFCCFFTSCPADPISTSGKTKLSKQLSKKAAAYKFEFGAYVSLAPLVQTHRRPIPVFSVDFTSFCRLSHLPCCRVVTIARVVAVGGGHCYIVAGPDFVAKDHLPGRLHVDTDTTSAGLTLPHLAPRYPPPPKPLGPSLPPLGPRILGDSHSSISVMRASGSKREDREEMTWYLRNSVSVCDADKCFFYKGNAIARRRHFLPSH